jgi:hypothetical protein
MFVYFAKKLTFSEKKMKKTLSIILIVMVSSTLYSQAIPEKFDPKVTLSSDKCYDVIKTVWDGIKKISEEYSTQNLVKSEFESSGEFADRVRKTKDAYINAVNKYALDNKLNDLIYSVWLKADLVKYDADNQVYSVKSSSQILVQPKKNDIAITITSNKYATIEEKNHGGYRTAHFQLNTTPEFSWFVNKQTALSAKNKEHQIFFKLSFKFEVFVNESNEQIVIQLVPTKLALMDQQENFTYWSEEIR